MSHPGNRGLEYRRLSSHVQRVILGLGPLADLDDRKGSGSASECGARTARGLELGSSGHEARALKEMSDSLYRHHYARGDHQQDSYAGVVVAAEGLRFESPAFVNPPLNAIWAEANHAVDDARSAEDRQRSIEAAWEAAVEAAWEGAGGPAMRGGALPDHSVDASMDCPATVDASRAGGPRPCASGEAIPRGRLDGRVPTRMTDWARPYWFPMGAGIRGRLVSKAARPRRWPKRRASRSEPETSK